MGVLWIVITPFRFDNDYICAFYTKISVVFSNDLVGWLFWMLEACRLSAIVWVVW